MEAATVVAIGSNILVFAALGGLAVASAAKDPSVAVRRMGVAIVLVCTIFLFGAVQRLVLYLHRAGLTSNDLFERFLFEWQLARSLFGLALGTAALTLLGRSFRSLQDDKRKLRALTDHVGVVPAVSKLGLTPRELEVLKLIGSGQSNDVAIANTLHISPHTARTHVRNIMAKSGLPSRRDLVLLIDDL